MTPNLAGAVAGVVAVAVLASGCTGPDGDRAVAPRVVVPEPPMTGVAHPVPKPDGPASLTAFASCSSLLRHFKREAMKVVTPYGLPGVAGAVTDVIASPEAVSGTRSGGGGDRAVAGSASVAATGSTKALVAGSAGAPYSGTNIQEAGVDEPDLVKSDGRRLVTLARGRLTVVDIEGAAPRILGSLALPREQGASELLWAGNRVVVLGQGWGGAVVDDGTGRTQSSSTVQVVDISDPAAPTAAATMTLEGRYVSARLAGGVVRLVMESGPKGPAFAVPTPAGDPNRLLSENRDAIRRSRVEDWVPSYRLERPGQEAVTAPLAPCSSVLRPKEFAGFGTVSVLTLDPADPKPTDTACVLGGGHIVYAGPDNLYVATGGWAAGAGRVGVGSVAIDGSFQGSVDGPVGSTQLHRFAIPGRQPAAYVASGEVEGSVLNQFSMSEHEGRLRVATTVGMSGGRTESMVHVLEAQGGRLVSVGRLGGLGHAGETIQSVRFIGARGYVVTFRQTDPLYVIDLQDPRHPRLRGELQVPGFSSYLHPLSDSVLLGVGQGPGERGGQGLQLSLFDVRHPARPVRTANTVFENAYSPAQQDHHAFLWWAPAGRVVLPVQEYAEQRPFTGAVVVDVDPAKGFGAVHRVSHTGHAGGEGGVGIEGRGEGLEMIQRAMVAGTQLLTLSDAGLLTVDVTTLDERAWLGWPA